MPTNKKDGYLIPDNPAPAGYRCIALLIPDDDMYLYAIGGQYHDLTQWLSWEKDGTNRASLAAGAWKAAYDETMRCYWQKDIIMSICNEEWQELIDKLEDINQTLLANNSDGIINTLIDFLPILTASVDASVDINATLQTMDASLENYITTNPINNIFVDCIDCTTIPPINPPPAPNPDPVNPPGGIPANEWQDYLCSSSNYLYQSMVIDTFDNTEQIVGFLGSAAAISLLVGVMAGTGVGVPLAVVTTLIAVLLSIESLANRADVFNDLETVREAIVCKMYQGTGTQEVVTFIQGIDWIAGIEAETVDWIRAVLNAHVLNELYTGSVSVPDGYNAPVDCDSCGAELSSMYWNIDSNWIGTAIDPPISNNDFINYNVPYLFRSASNSGLQITQEEIFGNNGTGQLVTVTCTFNGAHQPMGNNLCLRINNGLPTEVEIQCTGSPLVWVQPFQVPILRITTYGLVGSQYEVEFRFTKQP